MPSIRSAMVFAAGEGRRMLPLTQGCPKPLLKVDQKALLDYTLDNLIGYGVSRVVINCCYLGEQIKAHMQTKTMPFDVVFSEEESRLETGGGVVKALPLLESGAFFALNADIILLDAPTQSTLQRMEEQWDDSMRALMLLVPVEEAIGYDGKGDVNLAADGTVIVPDPGEKCRYVFSGVQILSPSLFKEAKEEPFSLYRDWVFPRCRQPNGEVEGVCGVVHTGKWLHVGTPEHIETATRYLAAA